MRYDGDEGLFRAYESVEFLAPLYAGDWIEAKGRIVRVGQPSRDVRVRGMEDRRAADRHQRVGGGVPGRARPDVPGGGDDRRDEGSPAVRARVRRRPSGRIRRPAPDPGARANRSSTLNGLGMNASAPISAALARSRRFAMAETTTTRGRSSMRRAASSVRGRPPVHRGHHDVEQHELRMMLGDGESAPGLPSRAANVGVALRLEAELEHPHDLGLVVDDEHAGAESRWVRHGPQSVRSRTAVAESAARAVSRMATRAMRTGRGSIRPGEPELVSPGASR